VFIEKAMRGTANWPPHTQLVWAVKASDGSPDATASGTALLNAVAAIPTSGNDAPSSTNPWLVRVGPGVFDLSGAGLVLPSWVNLDGAGDGTTKITSNNNQLYVISQAAGGINLVSNVYLSNFNAGTHTYGVVANGLNLTLDHVFINCGNGLVTVALSNSGAQTTVYDSIIGSGGYGLYVDGGGPVSMYRTQLSSSLANVYNFAGAVINLAYSQVPGALSNFGPGVFHCIGNFNDTLAPVTCP
jgi:hypothetical protein